MGASHGGIDHMTGAGAGAAITECYDDWLMGLLIEHGVETVLPKIHFHYKTAAVCIGHIQPEQNDETNDYDYMLTKKAVRYLQMLNDCGTVVDTQIERNE